MEAALKSTEGKPEAEEAAIKQARRASEEAKALAAIFAARDGALKAVEKADFLKEADKKTIIAELKADITAAEKAADGGPDAAAKAIQAAQKKKKKATDKAKQERAPELALAQENPAPKPDGAKAKIKAAEEDALKTVKELHFQKTDRDLIKATLKSEMEAALKSTEGKPEAEEAAIKQARRASEEAKALAAIFAARDD